MSALPARMLVMMGDQCACIRIMGRANFASSVDFGTLVNELRRTGCGSFVLDLSECVLMDSTFLGVLAGFGLKYGAGEGGQGRRGIKLLNPSARITELLETLGVLHLFELTQGSLDPAAFNPPQEAAPANATKAEMARTSLEAHQTLMGINPANAARFKDVAQFLAEDLKNQGSPLSRRD